MSELPDDCGALDNRELSPRISAAQMDAITWPRESIRRRLGEQLTPARKTPSRHVLSNDPELARRINDLLARHADR